MKFFIAFSLSLFLKIQTIINMKINSFSSNSKAWNTNLLNSKILFWLFFLRSVVCKLAFKLHLGNSLSLPRFIILRTLIQTSLWRFFFPPNICTFYQLAFKLLFGKSLFQAPKTCNLVSLHFRLFFLSSSNFVTLQVCIQTSFWKCLFPFLRKIHNSVSLHSTPFWNLFLVFSKIYIQYELAFRLLCKKQLMLPKDSNLDFFMEFILDIMVFI